jgi:uncharacterized membrane protein YgcG
MGSIKSDTNQERQTMKNVRLLTFVLIIGTLLLSACGARAATPTSAPAVAGSAKVQAMPVSFIGIVDSIAGDQWVISGTPVTVDVSIVRDGPFKVGDQVKVEGRVSPDGSFTVSRVEAPTPQETATLPPFADDNSNGVNTNDDTNINDSNINDDHGTDINANDDHGNDVNINDDHGVDANVNDANINDDKGGAGNTNDDNSNVASPSNSNDDHGGNSSGGGNDNGGSGKGSGGGNDNGGNSNDD